MELFNDHEIDICNLWDDFDQNKYDLYVLSWWSHHSVFFEPSPYQKELDFIKNTNKKVIGICLWCQIIAKTYDSIIDPLPEKITWTIDINYDNTIYTVFEAHRYAIKQLWDELVGIVKSEYGYEIIKHKTKNIRWFQFHPEKHMKKTMGSTLLQKIIAQ
jgi:anthranilate/para-aminobenzoate synthase component II